MRRSNGIVALMMAAVLVVSACGTSGSKTSTKNTTTTAKQAATATTTTTAEATTSPSPTTEADTGDTTTTVASGADAARAKAANIVASDFPSGWTSSEHTAGDATAFTQCAPKINLKAETVAQASSPDFERKIGATQTEATSLTRVLSGEDVAQSVIRTFGDAAFVTCVETFIKKEGFKAGTGAGKLSPTNVSFGDEAAGIDGKLTGTDSESGKAIEVGLSLVAVRTGDVVTVLTGLSLGGTRSTDAALFEKLAQSIASRQAS